MTEIKREDLDVDVLLVGAGPASLSCAIRLKQLIKEHNSAVEEGRISGESLDPFIAIVEKGASVGAHILSGAVMDPRGIEELMPDWEERGAPVEAEVRKDAVYFLTERHAMELPFVPPAMHNEGFKVISLSRFTRWMADIVKSDGVEIFTGFPAVDVLYDGDRVTGVQTGDKGIAADGSHKPNFEPGVNLKAKVTVFGEGVLGHCTRMVIRRFGLDEGCEPPAFETGVKEIIRLPPDVDRGKWNRGKGGRVFHTMGYPVSLNETGGTWFYDMGDDLVSIGLVVACDYHDPGINPHSMLQQLKAHPMFAGLLKGGSVEYYGAKALSCGGWYSVPRLAMNGAVLVGESGRLLNAMRLKGIHLAIKSGMLAAESIFQALLAGDTSAAQLQSYDDAVRSSWIKEEMWQSRNFHAGMAKGFIPGTIKAGISMFIGSAGRQSHAEDWTKMATVAETYDGARVLPPETKPDTPLYIAKLDDVFKSGTLHDEDQPCHLKVADTEICVTRCAEEYQNPCTRFCPAQVYEMIEKDGHPQLQVNFSNCVHCKTCDIKDPYQIITWTPPEGGGGPNYTLT